MSSTNQSVHVRPGPSAKRIASLAIRLVALLAILAALLFVPAGRLDWLDAWLFIAAHGALLAAYSVYGLWRDPAQLQERSRVASNTKTWDKVILGAYSVCILLTFILAGLDGGRFQWSFVSLPVKAAGWLALALAEFLIFWAVVTNTYLARVARIQDDRGQTVVRRGPYGLVRHPMYAGIILMFLCTPLVLGSWWALIPGATIGALFVLRTSKEDRMLQDELVGYVDYTHKVRYRLLPGVW